MKPRGEEIRAVKRRALILMRILSSDKISKRGIELLQREPEFQVEVKTDLTREALMACIGEYDALIVRSATKVTHEVI